MHKVLGALAVFAVLGTAATAAWATAPGKNGEIVFRRYLDPGRTTGAIFTIRSDGAGVSRRRSPARPPPGSRRPIPSCWRIRLSCFPKAVC